MRRIRKEFRLDAEGIDAFSEFLLKNGISDKNERTVIRRISLILESVLLEAAESKKQGNDFSVTLTKRFGKTDFELKIGGDPFNPLSDGADDTFEKMRDALGLTPQYSYTKGFNVFSVSVFKALKLSFAGWLVAAIIGGILLGIIGLVLPPKFIEYTNIVFTPLSDAVFGLIKMTSLPVVFLCAVSGILSCGDISTLGKVGKKIMGEYMKYMLALLLLTVAGFLIIQSIPVSMNSEGKSTVETLIVTLFSIFPDNLLAPFMNGDNIQVIIIALLFGAGLLVMGERARDIEGLIEKLKELCSMIMQAICTLMPVMVFILIAQNIWNKTEVVSALSAWKTIVLIIAVYLIGIAVDVVAVARKKGLTVSEILRAIGPICLKAFISCSSMFVYTEMLDTLKKDLKTESGHADFSLPLGMAFFQPDLVLISGITLYFASISGVKIDISWLLSLILISYLYSVAAPPVSGGFVAIIAAMFEGLGVSQLYLGLASSLIMLLDYPNTAGRVAMLMLEIAKVDKNNQTDL